VPALAQSHLAELDRRIEQFRRLREQLGAAVRHWQSAGTPPDCASTFGGLIDDGVDLPDPVPPRGVETSFSRARTPKSLNSTRS
jgi:hypothetical protein